MLPHLHSHVSRIQSSEGDEEGRAVRDLGREEAAGMSGPLRRRKEVAGLPLAPPRGGARKDSRSRI